MNPCFFKLFALIIIPVADNISFFICYDNTAILTHMAVSCYTDYLCINILLETLRIICNLHKTAVFQCNACIFTHNFTVGRCWLITLHIFFCLSVQQHQKFCGLLSALHIIIQKFFRKCTYRNNAQPVNYINFRNIIFLPEFL